MTRAQAARIRHIRGRMSYTVRELGSLLKIHPRTIQHWHQEGLRSIDDHSHPLLFLGETVRNYLRAKMARRRVKLGPDEFYCPGCHRPAQSNPEKVTLELTGKMLGNGREQVFRRGECSVCGCRMVRFASVRPQNGSCGPVVATQGESRLDRALSNPVNTDKERDNHAT